MNYSWGRKRSEENLLTNGRKRSKLGLRERERERERGE
jgi:hypothetical protein